jgi:hypothetical protein
LVTLLGRIFENGFEDQVGLMPEAITPVIAGWMRRPPIKQIVAIFLACTVAQANADLVFFQGFEDVSRPVRGAVVFSETMSDPTAVSDSLGEWIELANASGQSIGLGGCVVVSDSGSVTLPSMTLASDEFALIVRHGDQGTNGGLSADATFTFALASSGTLQLVCAGVVIDQISWASSEQAGRSRSLHPSRTSALANDDPANWCFATALYNANDKGSPGLANEACPGVVEPDPAPGPGELSITELMIDPAVLSDTEAEWVELRSTADGTRDLVGCVLSNGITDSVGFPSLQLASGAYALVGRSGNPGQNGGLSIDATFAFSLTNSSGTVSVKCGDAVIDTVSWASSVLGRSLQRDPVSPTTVCTVPMGTPAYTDSNFGTPKADNPACP